MIIFLYGPDSYRRQQKLKDILVSYKNKHSSFSVDRFDLETDSEFMRMKNFLKAQSLFDKFKLGIINNNNSLSKKQEYISLLKDCLNLKNQVLVLSEDKKMSKEFNFLIKKPVLSQEFRNLSGLQFQKFLLGEARKRKLNFDKESVDLLMRFYSSNTWGLITELDKLALLDEKSINRRILESHLHSSLPINSFSLINQIKNSSHSGNRLSLLEKLLTSGANSPMIFNVLSALSGSLKNKQIMADYDVMVKSGKLEYDQVLLDIVL